MEQSVREQMALWLFICCGMIFGMVVLGGLTRLTGSGLSMVTWAPVLGWLPPLDEATWREVFRHYQGSPEFMKINFGMDLEGFKGIFWLEYLHRLIGRLTGLLFLLPFFYFLFRRQIDRPLARHFVFIFFLGGLQGGMGWYMVQSGLVDNPHVSHYRLTLHLGFAFLIYAYIFWLAVGLKMRQLAQEHETLAPHFRLAATLLTGLIFLTVLSGGLVAGLHAGLTFNTFPLMDGLWFPLPYMTSQPFIFNFLENVAAVQWGHRILAVTVFFSILLFWFLVRRASPSPPIRMGTQLLFVMSALQIILGISTLLLYVPVSLASIHQSGALVLFTLALFVTRQLYPVP